MRPQLVLAMSLLSVAFVGCGPASTDRAENLAATVGTQSAQSAGYQPVEVPAFEYAESLNLHTTRQLSIFDNLGRAERFHEDMHSDGAGQVALGVLDYASFGVSTWSTPTSQLESSYFNRQAYLLKYRDLHLGSEFSLHRNFRWTEAPGVVQMAGEDCKVYHARSVHGLGDFDLVVTVATNLLLGWTSLDALGQPVMQLETLTMDESPTHNGVAWASAAVPEQPYTDVVDEPLLGFTPVDAQYLPPGFYLVEKRLLLANGLTSGFGNIHAAVYTDGIHLLLVAQQKYTNSPAMTILSGPSLVKHADVGGIRVAEGDIPGKRLYVVSQLPTEELQTIFGSMY